MNVETSYIVVGKVGAVYGVRGWVKIVSFTEAITDILDYDPWFLENQNAWKQTQLEGVQQYGKGLIAKFAGFDSPEIARQLTGKKIAIQRSQLAKLKKNEYYWADLEGLTVINQDDKVLGKIIYLLETGSNDVFVVKGEKEHAIPYLPNEVVTNIDLENRVMRVNWEEI